jgi:hypothetical protein
MHKNKPVSLDAVLRSDDRSLSADEKKRPEAEKIVLRWKHSAKKHIENDLLALFATLEGAITNTSYTSVSEVQLKIFIRKKNQNGQVPEIEQPEAIISKRDQLSKPGLAFYRKTKKHFITTAEQISAILCAMSDMDGINQEALKEHVRFADAEMGNTLDLYAKALYNEFKIFERITSAKDFMSIDPNPINDALSKCFDDITERDRRVVASLESRKNKIEAEALKKKRPEQEQAKPNRQDKNELPEQALLRK